MVSKLCNPALLDQEELKFMYRIVFECGNFHASLNNLRKKRASLDRALERFKKARNDLYEHECNHADAIRHSRDKIKDISFMIEKYNNYMKL